MWRVGHRPDPWAWALWKYAVRGRFGGRWDDPDGTFRTVYAGESLLACLLEVLACFRPDTALSAELDAIEDNGSAKDPTPPPPPGVVPRSWALRRCVATAQMTGQFCAVSHSKSISAPRASFLADARELGLEDFDAAALRDSRPRGLTQRVAARLWQTTDLDGVRYSSRHGDDHMLWAVFERHADGEIAQCLTKRSTGDLTPDDRSLIEAFKIHHLSWEDPPENSSVPSGA